MDFNNIQFVMMGKHVKIYTDTLKKIIINVNMETAFGNEINNHMTYNNWILKEDNRLLFQNLEDNFKEHMILKYEIGSEWNWKTSLRPNGTYENLLRTTNKSKCEYIKKNLYEVDITIDSIWLHKQTKTFGLMLQC